MLTGISARVCFRLLPYSSAARVSGCQLRGQAAAVLQRPPGRRQPLDPRPACGRSYREPFEPALDLAGDGVATGEGQASVASFQQVLGGQASAGHVVGRHPAARSVTGDAVDVDERNALLDESLEPGIGLLDRADDDAVHPLLHQQVEVLFLPADVLVVRHDDDADTNAPSLGVHRQGHVDEERVAHVGTARPSVRTRPGRNCRADRVGWKFCSTIASRTRWRVSSPT